MQLPETHFVNGHRIQPPFPDGLERALFAMGCFWGPEKTFWQLPGVYSTAVGYAGGRAESPSYQQVCTGTTGHAEAVQVIFDPKRISYQELLRVFWESHDPMASCRRPSNPGLPFRRRWIRRATARSPPKSARRRRSTTPRIITSSTWRRIRAAIARITRAEFPINPRC